MTVSRDTNNEARDLRVDTYGRLLTRNVDLMGSVTDSSATVFDPSSCSHVYAYNASGLVTTDTATDGTATWVKTYSYTGANLTGETKWVKQ